MGYLTENNGQKSSQRVNLLGALVGILYLILTVGVYIVSRSFREAGIGESEWFGMGVFVFGLLSGLGINAGVKAYQKQFEQKDTNENLQ